MSDYMNDFEELQALKVLIAKQHNTINNMKCCGNCNHGKCRFGHGEHCEFIFDCPLSEISTVIESNKEYWKTKEY